MSVRGTSSPTWSFKGARDLQRGARFAGRTTLVTLEITYQFYFFDGLGICRITYLDFADTAAVTRLSQSLLGFRCRRGGQRAYLSLWPLRRLCLLLLLLYRLWDRFKLVRVSSGDLGVDWLVILVRWTWRILARRWRICRALRWRIHGRQTSKRWGLGMGMAVGEVRGIVGSTNSAQSSVVNPKWDRSCPPSFRIIRKYSWHKRISDADSMEKKTTKSTPRLPCQVPCRWVWLISRPSTSG
jgi:hypothetical protein